MAKGLPLWKRKGFSFVEMLIACSILVTVSSAAFLGVSGIIDYSRYSKAKTDVAALAVAVSEYRLDVGEYPATLTELTVKNGDYGPWVLEDMLKDPWDIEYNYYLDEDDAFFYIWSDGKDKTNDTSSPADGFLDDDIGIVAR